MSKQMITFSFRTTAEAVRKLRKEARQRKTSCGALLREMIELVSAREGTHEDNNHQNDCLGNDVGNGGV